MGPLMENDPDSLRHAQEVTFSWKRNRPNHPDIIFNGNPVKKLLPEICGNVS